VSREFECPECGEGKQLRGRREDAVVHITCLSCGHGWTHDPWKCPHCGGRMGPVRKPLLQKARGTQQSIIGYYVAKECLRCDPEDRSENWLSATADREPPKGLSPGPEG
jgi:hypothetical protein